jgi:glycine/D-amino acid oxidase-like deaminating enzyme
MDQFSRHLLLLALLLLVTTAQQGFAQTYDVVVYGGTSAGVIAAVQAARMGKSVVLLEPGQHLGGMSVEGLGGTDIDNHKEFQNSPAVGGLTLEFYRRVSRKYGREEAFDQMLAQRGKQSALWRFEPHVAEAVFNNLIREHDIRVLFRHRLAEKRGVTKDTKTKRITMLHCENGARIRGQMFIDATYEGDLLAAAGVTTVVGREGNAKYGETKNGIRTNTTHSQLDKRIDPYRIPGNPASGSSDTA